jgi:putative Holliday junction resolvase
MPNSIKTRRDGTYLGFDFGTKHLGIAVGQTITKTANPLSMIPMKKGAPNYDLLDAIVEKWQPLGLIIGLPLQPDGTHSQTSLAAKRFGQDLGQHYRLPIYYIEERLTSFQARQSLKDSPALTQAGQNKDAIAAAIILQSWLNSPLKDNCCDEPSPIQ